MKLLFCTRCGDVFNLNRNIKRCSCGDCGGVYLEDDHHAIYTVDPKATYDGDCIPLGISNGSMIVAISKWNRSGKGSNVTAFLIDKECPTFTKIEEV